MFQVFCFCVVLLSCISREALFLSKQVSILFGRNNVTIGTLLSYISILQCNNKA